MNKPDLLRRADLSGKCRLSATNDGVPVVFHRLNQATVALPSGRKTSLICTLAVVDVPMPKRVLIGQGHYVGVERFIIMMIMYEHVPNTSRIQEERRETAKKQQHPHALLEGPYKARAGRR